MFQEGDYLIYGGIKGDKSFKKTGGMRGVLFDPGAGDWLLRVGKVSYTFILTYHSLQTTSPSQY